MKAVERTEVSAPFFDGAAEGRLLIQRCNACLHSQFVSVGYTAGIVRCRACASKDLSWVDTESRGMLVTFIATPQRDGGMLVGGIVELAAGPWMFLTIEADPATLAVGQPMRIEFATPEGSETLPYAVGA